MARTKNKLILKITDIGNETTDQIKQRVNDSGLNCDLVLIDKMVKIAYCYSSHLDNETA